MTSRRNFFKQAQQRKWKEGSYHNPYFETDQRPWKQRLMIGGALVGVAALLLFLIFTPLLRLQTYTVEGADVIGADAIEAAARASLAERRFGVIPKDHLLVFSEEAITQALFETFRLDRLEVSRKGRELHLRVTEKISRLLWETSDGSYVIDEQGVVLSRLDTPLEDDPLTHIRSLRSEPVLIGEHVLDPEVMTNILDLLLELRKGPLMSTTLEIDSSEANFLRVNMEEGYTVYFDPTVPMFDQLGRLVDVLKGESANPAGYEYVDVRFGERVYIKDR